MESLESHVTRATKWKKSGKLVKLQYVVFVIFTKRLSTSRDVDYIFRRKFGFL